MAFTEQDLNRPDWPLLQNGAVNLFYKINLYENTISDLKKLKYKIHKITIESLDKFYLDISHALKWQKQFGYSLWNGNLDALNDGFRDEPFDSADQNSTCIDNFNELVKLNKNLSYRLLDIIERSSRDYLLFGKKLTALIQTNDKHFSCSNIGSTRAHWNRMEFFDKDR